MDKKKNIGDLLIELGKISREDLEEGLRLQKEFNLRLGETLVKLGKITMSDIEWVLSKQLDIPFVIVENINIDQGLLFKFSKELLVKNRILPLYETHQEIAIATDDPLNKEVFESIEGFFNKKIRLSSANGEKIGEILNQFFSKTGAPSLVTCIEDLLEKIVDTCFYRIDFILSDNCCDINMFGFGILKRMFALNDVYTSEQVFESFESLSMGFLYEVSANEECRMVSVYPMINNLQDMTRPAVIGTFGLFLPQGVTFSSMKARGLPFVINAPFPTPGYPFISLKDKGGCEAGTVYTVDSVPINFGECYVNISVPRQCGLCKGKGCAVCGDLGYVFTERLKGVYSAEELKHIISEVSSWQR
jgi:hypothetical protein